MADAFEEQEWVRTGVAATLLRSLDGASPDALQSVATLLRSALPNRTKLEFKGLFAKKLFRVTVTFGDDAMALELDAVGGLLATRVHISRGIALKREEWPLDRWVAALVAALEAKAESDETARRALDVWVGRAG
ncbi:MAG: hypothetical protein ACYC96_05810 [Fimbriimonadaceae bacterium]